MLKTKRVKRRANITHAAQYFACSPGSFRSAGGDLFRGGNNLKEEKCSGVSIAALEAASIFGHQTKGGTPRWLPYLYGGNGIYIIVLQKTGKKLEEAYKLVRDMSGTEKHTFRGHEEAGAGLG
jgi:hypothetical protein